MDARGTRLIATVVTAVVGLTGMGANAGTISRQASILRAPQVTHRFTVTPRAGAASQVSVSRGAQAAPMVTLPRRAILSFTVAQRTLFFPSLWAFPKAAGRYVAFYLPSVSAGWVLMPDPGSVRGWPAVLEFGRAPFAMLEPGHKYTALVATERVATLPMPFPMRVVKIRPARFSAVAVVRPLDLPAPVTFAAFGSVADALGRLSLSTTAVSVDWNDDPSPVDSSDGDACPSSSQAPLQLACAGSASATYEGFTSESDSPVGGPYQRVTGEAFDEPVTAAYITGYFEAAPIPFGSATLYGFSMDAAVR